MAIPRSRAAEIHARYNRGLSQMLEFQGVKYLPETEDSYATEYQLFFGKPSLGKSRVWFSTPEVIECPRCQYRGAFHPESFKDGNSCPICNFFITNQAYSGLRKFISTDVAHSGELTAEMLNKNFELAKNYWGYKPIKEEDMSDDYLNFWEDARECVKAAALAEKKGFITAEEARETVRRRFPVAAENDKKVAEIARREAELAELKDSQ